MSQSQPSNEAPARKPGRPRFEPNKQHRETVQNMAMVGTNQDDIATVLGIDPKTLRRHFPVELAKGAIQANARVAAALFKKATGNEPGSVPAAIFWLKVRAGWKETTIQEHVFESHEDALDRLK